MNQSRLGSLIEACIGTAIGFVMSIVLSLIVYPLHGHSFTLLENVSITMIFTIASVIRSYLVRRFFNMHIHRAAQRMASVAS